MAAWHYSNLAYALLGIVVARVSGKPSATTCRSGCSARSGSSGRRGGRATAPRCRISSSPTPTRLRREPVLELGGKGGESGLYSTVGDLARWGAFLCDPDESLLKRARRSRRCTT